MIARRKIDVNLNMFSITVLLAVSNAELIRRIIFAFTDKLIYVVSLWLARHCFVAGEGSGLRVLICRPLYFCGPSCQPVVWFVYLLLY